MVAHVVLPAREARMTPGKLTLALNAHLPEDVRVTQAARCPDTFHARFDAVGKQYRYFIWNASAMNPLLRDRAWHVPRPLDVPAMRAAARFLLGRHDFRAFTANRGYPLESSERTLTRCAIRRGGPLLTFILEADGFLYKMCRGLVGTLAAVGLRKLSASEVPAILASRDRRVAGMSAPAHGLVLWEVRYPPPASAAPSRQPPPV
jgi:tRNA pseudouridine38-40 synthase